MTSQQHSNNRATTINQLVTQLNLNGNPTTQTSDATITVNGQLVLVRTSHTINSHMCVELFHEGNDCKWVKSWGLSTPAKLMVHLTPDGTQHWYKLDKLREHITNRLLDNTYTLVNNTYDTRANNKVSSNVMNVWVPFTATRVLTCKLDHPPKDYEQAVYFITTSV